MIAASVCPYHYSAPARIIAWFLNVTDSDLISAGLGEETAAGVIEARDTADDGRRVTVSQRRSDTLRFKLNRSSVPDEVFHLRRVLVISDLSPHSRAFDLLSVNGTRIGAFEMRREIPNWWRSPHLVAADVAELHEEAEDQFAMKVTVREL
ncbi:MAG: hypothetical protein L0387_34715 [Acidobacteria bacterium]|nr:hypothetical protein [Acidobacteriota bacterium]MCI0718056.1 hypothetical protein [Acidobacteriota bacterium]